MKTNKSFSKRIKVTKNGKLIARKPGQNHFNAKESSSGQMSRNRSQKVSFSAKINQRYINTITK